MDLNGSVSIRCEEDSDKNADRPVRELKEV